jgi:hypothetical protein
MRYALQSLFTNIFFHHLDTFWVQRYYFFSFSSYFYSKKTTKWKQFAPKQAEVRDSSIEKPLTLKQFYFYSLILNHDGLVLRHEGLHDAPADEISHGTDAEHHHVGGRLTLKAEEGEGTALSRCPGKEIT